MDSETVPDGGKRKKKPTRRRKPKLRLVEAAMWIDDDGLHGLLPGTRLDQMMEELTRRYQEHIRRSTAEALIREPATPPKQLKSS